MNTNQRKNLLYSIIILHWDQTKPNGRVARAESTPGRVLHRPSCRPSCIVVTWGRTPERWRIITLRLITSVHFCILHIFDGVTHWGPGRHQWRSQELLRGVHNYIIGLKYCGDFLIIICLATVVGLPFHWEIIYQVPKYCAFSFRKIAIFR